MLILIKSQRERRERNASFDRPVEMLSSQQAQQQDRTLSPTTYRKATQESLSTSPNLCSVTCSIPFSAIKTQPKQHALVAQNF